MKIDKTDLVALIVGIVIIIVVIRFALPVWEHNWSVLKGTHP